MSVVENSIADKLEAMYNSYYEKNCNYKNCSCGMSEEKFKFDFSLRIGCKYGENGFYKVLAVGKESKDKHSEIIAPSDNIQHTKNTHYRGTLYTLALIAGYKPKSLSAGDLQEYNDLLMRFCLTNYFKCAFKKANRNLPVNRSMQESCCQILLREIEIVQPDIVLMQGKFFGSFFPEELGPGTCCYCLENGKISLVRYTLKQHTFYVLWGYHPASAWWKKEPNFSALQEAIRVFRAEFPC